MTAQIGDMQNEDYINQWNEMFERTMRDFGIGIILLIFAIFVVSWVLFT